MDTRLKILIGDDFNKLTKVKVLIVGIGGVGGYVLECLIRSGIKNITVMDPDKVEITNLNRQILATNNINEAKVISAQKRALSINPDCKIEAIQQKLTIDNIDIINEYDYVIDACDDVQAKVSLIIESKEKKINLISCLGTANRFQPMAFKITTLDKTYHDPLAKKIKNKLPKKYWHTKVVWSEEYPIKRKELGTICPVPMGAGSLLAMSVLNDIINQ